MDFNVWRWIKQQVNYTPIKFIEWKEGSLNNCKCTILYFVTTAGKKYVGMLAHLILYLHILSI